ncbi:Aste57867_10240 [Aphanomyces stellatus]|uniref:Aste57867_10240 protein n=1 Tax=Aphanomyces stellatus TaxID=120398 RepID=A0A485KPV1_9STRA|nr:hypothetical protein As57867_010201 [Aphanomyces stellatus]VFT87115.1 Aste57867_10240 [Aphanomyces stellatus]
MPELHVRVVAGRNLIDNSLTGTLNPQCIVTVGTVTQSTKVHENGGRSPVWGDKFVFRLMKDPHGLHMRMVVQDNKFFEGFMGQCHIAIKSLMHGTLVDEWVPVYMNKQVSGEVNLRMQLTGLATEQQVRNAKELQPAAVKEGHMRKTSCEDNGQTANNQQATLLREARLAARDLTPRQVATVLHVRVIGGRNLFDCSLTGTLHPQCGITVGNATKWTKTHRYGGRSPTWGDKFEFRMRDPLSLAMHLVIQDCKMFEGDMGTCTIPLVSLAHGEVVNQWVPVTINNRANGEVNLQMHLVGLMEHQVMQSTIVMAEVVSEAVPDTEEQVAVEAQETTSEEIVQPANNNQQATMLDNAATDLTQHGPQEASTAVLLVEVIAGRNLFDGSRTASRHPQCRITVGNSTQSTTAHRDGGRAPVWGNKFEFRLRDDPLCESMHMAVQDCSMPESEMGNSSIPLLSLAHGNVVNQWVPLASNGRANGEVYMSVQLTILPKQQITASKEQDIAVPNELAVQVQSSSRDEVQIPATKEIPVQKPPTPVAKDDKERSSAAPIKEYVEIPTVNNQEAEVQTKAMLAKPILSPRSLQQASICLHVRVVAGRNLIDNSLTGTLNPQCIVTVGTVTQSTKVHENGGRSPVWGDKFVFRLMKDPHGLHIRMVVQDNKFFEGFMGQCHIAIKSLMHGTLVDEWVPVYMNKQVSGELNLRMQLVGLPDEQVMVPKEKRSAVSNAAIAAKQPQSAEGKQAQVSVVPCRDQTTNNQQTILHKEAELVGQVVGQRTPQQGATVLCVHVIEGRNLFDCSLTGTLHPQCRIKVGTLTHSTKVHRHGGQSPSWGEKFQFRMRDPLRLNMRVVVQDCKMFEGDMGQYSVPLLSLAHGNIVNEWVPLTINGRPNGEVHLCMQLVGLTVQQVADALEAQEAVAREERMRALRAQEQARQRAQAQQAAKEAAQKQAAHAEAVRRIQQQVQAKFNNDVQQELIRRRLQHMPHGGGSSANHGVPADNGVPIYAVGNNGGGNDGYDLFGCGGVDVNSLVGGGVDVNNIFGGGGVDVNNLFGGGVDLNGVGDLAGAFDVNDFGDVVGNLGDVLGGLFQ